MKKSLSRLLVLLVLLATALVVDWRIAQARPGMDLRPFGGPSLTASRPVSTTNSGDPDLGGTIRDPNVPTTRLNVVSGGRDGLWFYWTSMIWAKCCARAAF